VPPQPLPLDDIDRRIIALLTADGRMSFVDIGARIGLSAPAVKRRVDRLRQGGVITGFTALVWPGALGWSTEAYVEVYCDSAAPPRRLADVARHHPEVVAAVTVTGNADALLHIRAADVAHFENVLERIRTESSVCRTDSRMVLTHLIGGGSAGDTVPGGAPDAGGPGGR